ncbi:hypothetical protein HPB51_027360 [Rhipicephalus microplus]|uniref:Abc transporter n=1 Tax=Rhipicephalus microplus TaxID=6941 RepID=A0A9J6D0F9_RHIMP|nr:hypothetical protein HPB51_027360 [Rhipicephalus microplus]
MDQVVLIDEPTSGLDRSNTRLVWDMLLRVRRTSALLISTHDMTEADVLADRVIGLTEGTVVCNASPTYLKSLYGVGYKVRLKKSAKVPFQEQHALSILRRYAPSAEVLDDHPSQAIVGLHTVVSKDFDRMFHELERASFHLGIRSIGLTVSTLKDIYLKLTLASLSLVKMKERAQHLREGSGAAVATSERMAHSRFHAPRRLTYAPHRRKPSEAIYCEAEVYKRQTSASLSRVSRYALSYEPDCPDCGETFSTSDHMLWQCPALRHNDLLTTEVQWEKVPKSPVLAAQQRIVQRSLDAGARHGLLAPTWERPEAASSPKGDFPTADLANLVTTRGDNPGGWLAVAQVISVERCLFLRRRWATTLLLGWLLPLLLLVAALQWMSAGTLEQAPEPAAIVLVPISLRHHYPHAAVFVDDDGTAPRNVTNFYQQLASVVHCTDF